jgi:hypothetical protein
VVAVSGERKLDDIDLRERKEGREGGRRETTTGNETTR